MDRKFSLGDILDLAGVIRYGVPTARKESLAISRVLPGAPEDRSAEQKSANRYAAGFLFGLQHPTIAQAVQPVVDRIKTSSIPLFGGATPEEQSYASQGVRRAVMERQRGLSLADLLGR